MGKIFSAFLDVSQSLCGGQIQTGGLESATAFMGIAFEYGAEQGTEGAEVPDVGGREQFEVEECDFFGGGIVQSADAPGFLRNADAAHFKLSADTAVIEHCSECPRVGSAGIP